VASTLTLAWTIADNAATPWDNRRILVGSAVYGVRVLLTINNALVLSLGGSKLGHVQWVGPALTLSPLLAVVTAGIMVALLIYLAIFYALRVVEIFLLTALIPMFAVLWIQSADGTWLRNIGRELIVAVFIQSVHAGAFWLFIGLSGLEEHLWRPCLRRWASCGTWPNYQSKCDD